MKNNSRHLLFCYSFLLIPFLFLAAPHSFAQTDIVIKNPNGLNDLWVKIPDNGTVKEGEVELVGNTQPECAGLALKRFKRNLNSLGLVSSVKDVVSGGFTALGLVVPSGYAKYALLALKMTYKALSADSPEEFIDASVKEAIKQIGSNGIKIKDQTLVEKALKEGYKKIVDKLLKAPKQDLYNKPLTQAPCKNGSVKLTLEPPAAGDKSMQFTLTFNMDEECDCLYPDKNVSGSAQKLKRYNIWGTMPVTVSEIEFETVIGHVLGRKDKINLTLEYGKPEIHVDAECDCGNISYRAPYELFTGASTIFEDGGNGYFNTYGGNVAFTLPVSDHIGITADAGFYTGTDNSVKYNKTQVLVGVSLLPVKHDRNELSFSPHVLAGIASVTSTINSFSNTSTALSAAAGVDAVLAVSSKAGIAARADYNPVFNSNGVSSNFRLSLGVAFRLMRSKKK